MQLIETTGSALEGRRILMYSYGSGISASMFSLVGRRPEAPRFALTRLQSMVRRAAVAPGGCRHESWGPRSAACMLVPACC